MVLVFGDQGSGFGFRVKRTWELGVTNSAQIITDISARDSGTM